MRLPILSLSCLLVMLLMGVMVIAQLRTWPVEVNMAALVSIERHNAEACLAAGCKIPLSFAGMYELELVPGISDTLALNILRARGAILKIRHKSGCAAFTEAQGIGEKTARTLCDYILLE